MKDSAIRTEIADLRVSSIFFDEAFLQAGAELNSHSPEHRHGDYEIFFILEGELSVTAGGKTVRAGSGATVILPPCFDHETDLSVRDGYCMYFNVEKKAKAPGNYYEKTAAMLRDTVTVLPLGEEERFYVEHLAKVSGHPLPEESESHLVALLFCELIRKLTPGIPPRERRRRVRYINLIDRFINEHYREPLRLQDLSKAVHLCPKQITRIIRKEYGCSFPELIHQRRLDIACTMLQDSDLEIHRIAERVGYEYENYFYTRFRKAYGMTPKKYRIKYRKQNVREVSHERNRIG